MSHIDPEQNALFDVFFSKNLLLEYKQ